MSLYGGSGFIERVDHFLGQTMPGNWQEVTENSGTVSIAATGVYGGKVAIVTGAADGNRSALVGELNFQASIGTFFFDVTLTNSAAITLRAIYVGFTDTVALEMPIELSGTTFTSNASDGAGFVYDTAATTDTWRVASVKGDTDGSPTMANGLTGGNTNRAPRAAGTMERFRVEIKKSGRAIFSMSPPGSTRGIQQVATIDNAVTTTNLLVPVVYLENREAAAKTLLVERTHVRGAMHYNV